jgi:hypothetical protein
MILFHTGSIKGFGLLAIAFALSGCGSMGGGSEKPSGRIKITSEPAGAVAYADGAELGATPLQIVPGDHFRAGFAGLSYRYIGKLMIKRPGCETWSTEVNDHLLSKDIHAKLKCDPNYQPAAPSASASGSTSDPMPGAPSRDPYIERLERIEALHKKGLLSDEEYKQLRARIIDKL